MLAAVLVEQNRALELADIESPPVLDYGQVRVQVCYTSICGSQLGEIAGVKGPDRYLPHLLGHEGGGIVLELGPGVTHVRIGDKVVLHWRPGRGIQARPPSYRWKDQTVNAGWVTTFNEEAVVSENRLTPLPSDFDLSLAPLLGCAVTTGVGVVTRDAQVTLGESVLILGCGGVGLAEIQAAALSGAYPILAVDQHSEKLALAERLGATHCLLSDASLEEAVRSIAGVGGCDVVLENTGNTTLMRRGVELTHPQGRCILVGVPRQGDDLCLHTLPLHFGKRLMGSHGGQSRPDEDIPRLLRLIQAGRLDLESMISDRGELRHINHAIDRMQTGGVTGRYLLKI
ncbi:MAG: zinc-binding dehydrogenase [Chlamydiia bacterium]|nr:zinc-binding dehydrogenase [Chlamydiia bacterium]